MDTKRRTGNTFRPGMWLFPPGSPKASASPWGLLSGIRLATVPGRRCRVFLKHRANGWTMVFAGLWRVPEWPLECPLPIHREGAQTSPRSQVRHGTIYRRKPPAGSWQPRSGAQVPRLGSHLRP